MKREIKFRVWHNVEGLKKMYYLSGLIKFGEGWYGGNPELKFYEPRFGEHGFMRVCESEIDIMQFTGRVDKKGTAIYEGDIVKWETYKFDFDKPDEEEKVDVVKYSSIVFKDKGFWVEDEGFGWEGEDLWNWDEIEVIGNIYEHPLMLSRIVVVQASVATGDAQRTEP